MILSLDDNPLSEEDSMYSWCIDAQQGILFFRWGKYSERQVCVGLAWRRM